MKPGQDSPPLDRPAVDPALPDARSEPAEAVDAGGRADPGTDPGSERGSPPRDRDSGAAPDGGSSPSEGTNARRSVPEQEPRGEDGRERGHYNPRQV